MRKVRFPISIAAVFLWVGFALAFDLMQVLLNFQQVDAELNPALDLGQGLRANLQFAEWGMALLAFGNVLLTYPPHLGSGRMLLFYLPLIILGVQAFWLLPVLSDQAELVAEKGAEALSYQHLLYFGVEALKLLLLLVFGTKLFERPADRFEV